MSNNGNNNNRKLQAEKDEVYICNKDLLDMEYW